MVKNLQNALNRRKFDVLLKINEYQIEDSSKKDSLLKSSKDEELSDTFIEEYIEKVQLFTIGLENMLIEHDERQFVWAWNMLKKNASMQSFRMLTEDEGNLLAVQQKPTLILD